MPNLQSELAARVFFVTKRKFGKSTCRKMESGNLFTQNFPASAGKKIVPQKPPLGFLVICPFLCLTKQPLMTSLSFT